MFLVEKGAPGGAKYLPKALMDPLSAARRLSSNIVQFDVCQAEMITIVVSG